MWVRVPDAQTLLGKALEVARGIGANADNEFAAPQANNVSGG